MYYFFMPLTPRESRTSLTARSMAEDSNLASPSLVAILISNSWRGKFTVLHVASNIRIETSDQLIVYSR